MKGTFFLGNKKFETRETDLRPIKPDEVLIRVMACGICGTDIHIYHGEKGSADVKPPVILGHEFSGIVEKTGSEVKTVSAGDHVSVDPNIYCGKCHFCRTGKKQMCENLTAVGVNMDGGFAEYCVVPEAQCFKLAKGVDFEVGAMSEPLACCLHGIDLAGIRPGCSVCVIGGGAIGQIMVQLAKLSGAAVVILSEPVEMRRTIGRSLGADFTVDPFKENISERIKAYTGIDGTDCVIECVGNVKATKQAFEAAKRGATVLLFSVPKPDAIHELQLMDVFKKELCIRGSFINPDTHGRAVELINSGRINIKPLITHRFPVDKLDEAIAAQMSDASIKTVVIPHVTPAPGMTTSQRRLSKTQAKS